MADVHFGAMAAPSNDEDREWSVCWDFAKDVWVPPPDAVYPPTPWQPKKTQGPPKGYGKGKGDWWSKGFGPPPPFLPPWGAPPGFPPPMPMVAPLPPPPMFPMGGDGPFVGDAFSAPPFTNPWKGGAEQGKGKSSWNAYDGKGQDGKGKHGKGWYDNNGKGGAAGGNRGGRTYLEPPSGGRAGAGGSPARSGKGGGGAGSVGSGRSNGRQWQPKATTSTGEAQPAAKLPDELPPGLPLRPARAAPAVSSTSWATVDQEARQEAMNEQQPAETFAAEAPAAAPDASAAQAAPAVAGEEVDDFYIRKALRKGDLPEALSLIAQLPEGSDLTRVAVRVLTSLGKTPTLTEEVMDKLMDIAGRFNGESLETAAAEAQQRGDAAACHQLYQVAGLMSIPKTTQALTHLFEGQMHDPSRASSQVAEIVSADSAVTLTEGLAQILAKICTATNDQDLLTAVSARAESQGITVNTQTN